VIVKPTNRLLTREFEGTYWFRPEGKGTFMSSPAVKEAAENQIGLGASSVIVDLGGCLSMDSTFMGMLAGLAKILRKKSGELRIVGASEKSKNSLEELGLNALMSIQGDEYPSVSEIREGYHQLNGNSAPGKEDHILEAHENLCEADAKNEKTFKSVLEVLRQKGT